MKIGYFLLSFSTLLNTYIAQLLAGNPICEGLHWVELAAWKFHLGRVSLAGHRLSLAAWADASCLRSVRSPCGGFRCGAEDTGLAALEACGILPDQGRSLCAARQEDSRPCATRDVRKYLLSSRNFPIYNIPFLRCLCPCYFCNKDILPFNHLISFIFHAQNLKQFPPISQPNFSWLSDFQGQYREVLSPGSVATMKTTYKQSIDRRTFIIKVLFQFQDVGCLVTEESAHSLAPGCLSRPVRDVLPILNERKGQRSAHTLHHSSQTFYVCYTGDTKPQSFRIYSNIQITHFEWCQF